jgi:MFS family permease
MVRTLSLGFYDSNRRTMSAASTIVSPSDERSGESAIESGDRVGLRGHELSDQTNLLPLNQVITIFMGLSLCILISALDSVIVATALPTISAYFRAGSTSAWVPSAYLLTSTGFQPLYGRFSDIFGRKLTLCIAMGIYLVGSLVAGFSRSILQLVVFRGVAGVGGGGIITVCQVVISDVVSLRDRGKYQGIIGGVVALGYAVGPLVGGALSQKVSWRVSSYVKVC